MGDAFFFFRTQGEVSQQSGESPQKARSSTTWFFSSQVTLDSWPLVIQTTKEAFSPTRFRTRATCSSRTRVVRVPSLTFRDLLLFFCASISSLQYFRYGFRFSVKFWHQAISP